MFSNGDFPYMIKYSWNISQIYWNIFKIYSKYFPYMIKYIWNISQIYSKYVGISSKYIYIYLQYIYNKFQIFLNIFAHIFEIYSTFHFKTKMKLYCATEIFEMYSNISRIYSNYILNIFWIYWNI